MDKHYVRMSMTSAASKDRKDYETTQSLFGIPEESGWSIPVPAKKTEITRANIHAAFYMCQATPESLNDKFPLWASFRPYQDFNVSEVDVNQFFCVLTNY